MTTITDLKIEHVDNLEADLEVEEGGKISGPGHRVTALVNGQEARCLIFDTSDEMPRDELERTAIEAFEGMVSGPPAAS